jgi:hypothetical protein
MHTDDPNQPQHHDLKKDLPQLDDWFVHLSSTYRSTSDKSKPLKNESQLFVAHKSALLAGRRAVYLSMIKLPIHSCYEQFSLTSGFTLQRRSYTQSHSNARIERFRALRERKPDDHIISSSIRVVTTPCLHLIA